LRKPGDWGRPSATLNAIGEAYLGELTEHYKPFAMRLFSECSGLMVVALPLVPGGKFRVLERHQFRGMDFAAQASVIKAVCDRYWVTYIGIDVTGLGSGPCAVVLSLLLRVDLTRRYAALAVQCAAHIKPTYKPAINVSHSSITYCGTSWN